MHLDDIARLHAEHRRPGFGTLSVDELAQVDQVIADQRPRSFLEIGTASGLSGGMVAQMLDDHGGERLVTADLSEQFFADRTKQTGFVLPLIYPGGPDAAVSVERRVGVTAMDLVGGGESFDLALVDAGHVHPWPLIDTLCVNVVLEGRRTVLQHDLTLYRRQLNGRALGPKFLFDQFPESHRTRYDANGGNLFSVSLDLTAAEIDRIAVDAFAMPWTLPASIPDEQVEQIRGVLGEHYGSGVLRMFERASEVFNVPNGRYLRRKKPGADAPGQAG